MQTKQYTILSLCLLIIALFSIAAYAQDTAKPEVQPDAAGLLPEFNRWRNAIGIHSYQEDIRLSASAQFHSDDQINRNYFAHIAPSPVNCFGIPITQPAQRSACFGTYGGAEGIAAGSTDAAAATRSWISSYGHCTGVMNATATHMGGGHASTTSDSVKWKDIWTFQFNGETSISPQAQPETFCGCTKGKNTEGDIQACVTQYINQVHGGTTPQPAAITVIERPLARFPEAGKSYNKTNGGAICCFSFFPGNVTFSIVPVSGNPSDVLLELGDKNFTKIAGASGKDTFTYNVTALGEFSIWFAPGHLPDGDSFYIEASWESPEGGERFTSTAPAVVEVTPTEAPEVAQPAATACSVNVATVDELAAAINNANDEAACPGEDTLTLTADLQPTAGYEGSDTAFPAITSAIVIEGATHTISRAEDAPEFRFFFVNATDGGTAGITLNNIVLTGGRTLDSGAVFIDARNGGTTVNRFDNVRFALNSSNGNGGALGVVTFGGGDANITILKSTFDNNFGVYGGAFYSGGFDGGKVRADIVDTSFTNNAAQANGGALYNNGINGHATMTLTNDFFYNNNGPVRESIYTNGRANGMAALVLTNTRIQPSDLSQGELIYSEGVDGSSAVITTSGTQMSTNVNWCIRTTDDGMDIYAVDCPAR